MNNKNKIEIIIEKKNVDLWWSSVAIYQHVTAKDKQCQFFLWPWTNWYYLMQEYGFKQILQHFANLTFIPISHCNAMQLTEL